MVLADVCVLLGGGCLFGFFFGGRQQGRFSCDWAERQRDCLMLHSCPNKSKMSTSSGVRSVCHTLYGVGESVFCDARLGLVFVL